jgi:hypothetical protein
VTSRLRAGHAARPNPIPHFVLRAGRGTSSSSGKRAVWEVQRQRQFQFTHVSDEKGVRMRKSQLGPPVVCTHAAPSAALTQPTISGQVVSCLHFQGHGVVELVCVQLEFWERPACYNPSGTHVSFFPIVRMSVVAATDPALASREGSDGTSVVRRGDTGKGRETAAPHTHLRRLPWDTPDCSASAVQSCPACLFRAVVRGELSRGRPSGCRVGTCLAPWHLLSPNHELSTR